MQKPPPTPADTAGDLSRALNIETPRIEPVEPKVVAFPRRPTAPARTDPDDDPPPSAA